MSEVVMNANKELRKALSRSIAKNLDEFMDLAHDVLSLSNDLEERSDELFWFAEELLSDSKSLFYELGSEGFELLIAPTDETRENDKINGQILDDFKERLAKARDLLAEAMQLISHELELKNDF